MDMPKFFQEMVKGFKEVFEFILEVPELIGVLIILVASVGVENKDGRKNKQKKNLQLGNGRYFSVGNNGRSAGRKNLCGIFCKFVGTVGGIFFERVEWGVREN